MLRYEFSIGLVPGLILKRREGLLKGRRQPNVTVVKLAAGLNAGVNAGRLFIGVLAIAVGANIDAIS